MSVEHRSSRRPQHSFKPRSAAWIHHHRANFTSREPPSHSPWPLATAFAVSDFELTGPHAAGPERPRPGRPGSVVPYRPPLAFGLPDEWARRALLPLRSWHSGFQWPSTRDHCGPGHAPALRCHLQMLAGVRPQVPTRMALPALVAGAPLGQRSAGCVRFILSGDAMPASLVSAHVRQVERRQGLR